LNLFRRDLRPCIEQLDLPLVIAAMDIRQGQMLFLDRGPLGDALLSSSAFPGLLPPVPRGQALLVDGGFYNPALIREARRRGAEVVLFSDVCLITHLSTKPWVVSLYRWRMSRIREKPVSPPPDRPGLPRTVHAVLQTVGRLQERAPESDRSHAQVHLLPVRGEIKPLRFNRVRQGIELGREETMRRMGEIRDALAHAGGQSIC
jgi:predicted acylesterase/phospholipase RssA